MPVKRKAYTRKMLAHPRRKMLQHYRERVGDWIWDMRTRLAMLPVPLFRTYGRERNGSSLHPSETVPCGLFCPILDVKTGKLAEDTLTRFFEESMHLHVVTNSEGVILRVNKAWETILGYAPEELVGVSVFDLIYPVDKEATTEELSRLLQGIRTLIFENRYFHKNGSVRLLAWSANFSSEDQLIYGVASDITVRRAADESIKHLAFFDSLTGLPNRRLLIDRLWQALVTSARTGHQGALMFIDLDNFKALNDKFGHGKGDILLQKVAEQLAMCVREGDTVARLGGDEFVVMLHALSDQTESASLETINIGAKILKIFDEPWDLQGLQYRSSCSIGVMLFSNHEHTIDELFKRADIAMYQAKMTGGNTLRFFDAELQATVDARLALDLEMRQAIVQKEFILYFQAQVDAKGQLVGVEALLRWNHPQRGLLLPDEFMPHADESGLIVPIGQWVVETACAQLAVWNKLPSMADIAMAVNISAVEFRHTGYASHLLTVLDHTGIHPQKIKLEILESSVLNDAEATIAKITELQSYGLQFSLDNFGTGCSSLSYLNRLPIGQLKIDRSCVASALTDTHSATMVAAIISLGQSLGMAVIAEGVENEAQRLFLAKHHCDGYQGNLFGSPMPAMAFSRLMNEMLP